MTTRTGRARRAISSCRASRRRWLPSLSTAWSRLFTGRDRNRRRPGFPRDSRVEQVAGADPGEGGELGREAGDEIVHGVPAQQRVVGRLVAEEQEQTLGLEVRGVEREQRA